MHDDYITNCITYSSLYFTQNNLIFTSSEFKMTLVGIVKHNGLKFFTYSTVLMTATTLTMVISCERCDQAVCLPRQILVKSHWAFYKRNDNSTKSVLLVLNNSKDFNATQLFPSWVTYKFPEL